MTSKRECYVYIVLPCKTEFVTAARFTVEQIRDSEPIGTFVYGKHYLSRRDAVEVAPIELGLSNTPYQTARMNGFFGAIRDAMPDFWGRRVIERNKGEAQLDEFDYLMYGPDDRAGALGFGLHQEPPAPRREFSRTLELGALQEAAETLLSGNVDGE